MEQMTEMFMSMMEAKAKRDAPEIQRKEQASRLTKCLQTILTKHGLFDGRKATKYLKEYSTEMTIHKVSGKLAIGEFTTLVEPELKDLITRLGEEAKEDWKTFEQKVKEEFRFEDPDRVTSATFMSWVQEKDKKLGPQELLREFNRKYNQLPLKDVTIIDLRKGALLIQAADIHLRLELDNALDQIAPEAEDVTWKQAEEAIQKVTKQRKRREVDKGIEAPMLELVKATPARQAAEQVGKVSASEKHSDIASLTEMIAKLSLSIQALQENAARGSTSQANAGRTWNCLWCDSKEHQRRDCKELNEALRLHHVKFVEGKIAYYDSGEIVPMNVARGGMKVLVEQKMREKVAKVATTYCDPNVFCFQVSQQSFSIEHFDDIEKKRIAAMVRKKSGWEDPVLVNSITAQVGAAWNASIDDKRRHEGDALMEEAQGRDKQQRGDLRARVTRQDKRKEVRFEDSSGASQETTQGTPQDPVQHKKPAKKGPGYLLAREVETSIEGEEIAEKFWQQEARGFTNGDLFGSLRLELQNKVLERARRKRIYKEGPSNQRLSYEEGFAGEEDGSHKDGSVGDVFCASVGKRTQQASVNFHEMNSIPSIGATHPHWAKACPEIEVQLVGAKGSIRALLDSGSELNLMSKETYEKGQWMVDRDIKWNINSVGRDQNPLWGACPEVIVKLGNVMEPINVFVFEKLPYPLILGVPFITELRVQTMVLDDGTHMAKVKSKDNMRFVQFPTLRPENFKDRSELRINRELKNENLLEDFE